MRRWFIALAITVGLFALVLLAAGIQRYGSPVGLYVRVRAELISYLPRDPYVPTPLPTPVAVAQEVVGVTPEVPTVEPTATPTTVDEPVVDVAPTWEPTTTPAAIASPTATLEPTPTPIYRPAAAEARLVGFAHFWQTWSNCGPATLAMNLSYYGESFTQQDVGRVLRPNPEDRRVDIEELAAFAREHGYRAITRINGTPELLRVLISNDLPVVTPTWHVDPKGEGMGHYRLMTGYDDAVKEWIIYDSYESRGIDRDAPYQGIRMSYEQYAEFWAVLNNKYLVVHRPEQKSLVQAIIGEDMDDEHMYLVSLERAQQAVDARPEDPFAWVTLGTNLVHHGRYDEAAQAFDRARIIGLPHRAFWYQYEAFVAYVQTGRLEEALALVNATIRATAEIEELHYWRGVILREMGDLEGARAAFKTAVQKRPTYLEAQDALQALGG